MGIIWMDVNNIALVVLQPKSKLTLSKAATNPASLLKAVRTRALYL